MNLILASTSPRRKELLRKLNIPFTVEPSDFEEVITQDSDPFELVKKLSYGKAQAVVNNFPESVVIGADTVVVFDKKIYGKPHTADKALEMLKELNGTEHSIITGVTIIFPSPFKIISFAEETKIFFKQVSEQELIDYVTTGEPLDKAGAYAFQEKGSFLIDHIEGDLDNAIGLPVNKIELELKKSPPIVFDGP